MIFIVREIAISLTGLAINGARASFIISFRFSSSAKMIGCNWYNSHALAFTDESKSPVQLVNQIGVLQ